MPEAASSAVALNIGLLKWLRAAAGDYVSIGELARAVDATVIGGPGGGSPPADPGRVHAELDALVSFGFAIERHPYRGAAYLGPAERLCPDQIEHELATGRIGRRVAVWNRVSSTNDLAAGACGSTANDGLVILADEQTAGRGRLGRSWAAPPRSSILMSVVLFPTGELDAGGPGAGAGAGRLTAMGAVAAAEVVSAWIGRAAAIKWPNDVRVDGRKIAGILVERPAARGPAGPGSGSPRPAPPEGSGRAAVIGIGLNVNLSGDDLPTELRSRATSLRIERGGRPADRSEIARDLIRRLDHWYAVLLSPARAALDTSWRDRSEHIGRVVRVDTPTGSRSGRLVDLDLHRGLSLIVEDATETGRLHSGRGPHPDPRLLHVGPADILGIENLAVSPAGGIAQSEPPSLELQ